MSRLITSTILCFCICATVVAQNTPRRGGPPRDREEAGERIQVERIAFFTEKMGMTTNEAQAFWPIYNEMDSKKTTLFEEKSAIIRRFMTEPDNISEKELSDLLNRLVFIQQQEANLPAEYDTKFRKVLSDRKVMKLYAAEIQFRTYLLQKMRDRRDEVKPN